MVVGDLLLFVVLVMFLVNDSIFLLWFSISKVVLNLVMCVFSVWLSRLEICSLLRWCCVVCIGLKCVLL